MSAHLLCLRNFSVSAIRQLAEEEISVVIFKEPSQEEGEK